MTPTGAVTYTSPRPARGLSQKRNRNTEMKIIWILYVFLATYMVTVQYAYLILPGILSQPPEPWIFETIEVNK